VTAGEQVSSHVDGAVLAEQEGDGSSVPVRNILETAKLYALTEKKGLKGSLGGRGRQLSRRRRQRCFNTRNLNFATVFQHDAAPVDNPSDFTSAQQFKTAGLIAVDSPVDIFGAQATGSDNE
jgi:hypothetical protein